MYLIPMIKYGVKSETTGERSVCDMDCDCGVSCSQTQDDHTDHRCDEHAVADDRE